MGELTLTAPLGGHVRGPDENAVDGGDLAQVLAHDVAHAPLAVPAAQAQVDAVPRGPGAVGDPGDEGQGRGRIVRVHQPQQPAGQGLAGLEPEEAVAAEELAPVGQGVAEDERPGRVADDGLPPGLGGLEPTLGLPQVGDVPDEAGELPPAGPHHRDER